MAKDSYWFRHDSTAGRGLKLLTIKTIYGHWGKGVYWDVIETLREQSDYKYRSDNTSLKILAELIGAETEKFLNWYSSCVKYELLTEKNGYFYSKVLCENMEKWEAKKRSGSKGGRPKKENQKNLNKTELKPNRKLIESKSKANRKDNIREDNIRDSSKPELGTSGKFKKFISYFNEKLGKKYRGCSKSKSQFNARLKDGYTAEDFAKAIENALKDEHHKNNAYKHLTPEFITRSDKLEKFINQGGNTNGGLDYNMFLQ